MDRILRPAFRRGGDRPNGKAALERGGFRVFLSEVQAEPVSHAQGEERHRADESDGVGHPYARCTPSEHEPEGVARRNGHKDVGDERDPHDGLDVRKSAQGIGQNDLDAVAQLVEHQDRDQRFHDVVHGDIVGEDPSDDRLREEKHEADPRDHDQRQMYACPRRAANHVPVGGALVVADADGHGGTQTQIDRETDQRDGDGDLMGGQFLTAEPADHDGRHAERACLQALLQPDRPADGVQRAPAPAVDREHAHTLAVGGVGRAAHEHAREQDEDDDARDKGADACTEQSHLGESELAVDQYVVADDVQQVACQKHPHRHGGVGDALDELAEGIGRHDEQDRCHRDQVVGADQRHQLVGLVEQSEVQIDGGEDGRDEYCGRGVGHEAVLDPAADGEVFASCEVLADERGEVVGESRAEDDEGVDHVVHERGCAEFGRGVLSDHDRVGESRDDGSELADDDRHGQLDERFADSRIEEGGAYGVFHGMNEIWGREAGASGPEKTNGVNGRGKGL